MTSRHPLVLRALAPALILAGCLLLAPRIVQNPEMLAQLPGTGPAFWPRVMLWGTGACAFLWLVAEILRSVRRTNVAANGFVPQEGAAGTAEAGVYDNKRAVLAVTLTILYGVMLPILGFPLATGLFMAGWLLLGRIHRPLLLIAIPLLGTLVFCYVFVMLAHMPLEHGAGVMGNVTIGLYQRLGIY